MLSQDTVNEVQSVSKKYVKIIITKNCSSFKERFKDIFMKTNLS